MVNLGEITPAMEEEHYKATEPLPDQWWIDEDWISLKDKEPTPYVLLFDFIINKVTASPECIITSSNFPPRSIIFETTHPVRGVEYARLRISPTSVVEGAPEPGSNIEVDLILKMDYYDLAKMLIGTESVMAPIADGRTVLIGNLTAGIDLKDIVDLANGRPKEGRAMMWPDGHP